MSWIANVAAHAPWLMTVIPLMGAMLVWFGERRGMSSARSAAITNASLTMFVAGVMAWNFSPQAVGPQFSVSIPWWLWPLQETTAAAVIHFHLAFGVDGISLIPMLILAGLGWIVILLADRTMPAGKDPPYAGLLLGQALSISLFAVQDFACWILCGELWAWWAFLMIGRQGGEQRRPAARRLLLLSSLSRVCWMLAGMGMAVCLAWIQAEHRRDSFGVSFLFADMVGTLSRWIAGNETALQLWTPFAPWVLLLWLAGLWLQWPLFPAHQANGGLLAEAHAPVTALGGATLVLQGGYIWFRFVEPLLPASELIGLTVLSGCAGVGTLYFGLLAMQSHNWRALGGCLTLVSLQAAWLCGTADGVMGDLTAWRMICVTSAIVAGLWLLIGWREYQSCSLEFVDQNWMSVRSPYWFGATILCCGLLASLPCFSLFTGQAVLNLLELRQRGVPHFLLMAGSGLAAWAVIRIALRTGFHDAEVAENQQIIPEKTTDIRGRDCLLALPVVLGLVMMISGERWRQSLLPTWQRLHDPFAVSSADTACLETSPQSVTVQKASLTEASRPTDFPWLSAPLFWGLCGALLVGMPRGLLTPKWAWWVALIGWCGGGLAEWFGGTSLNAINPSWCAGCLISLLLIGGVDLTVISPSTARSAAALGGLLLRFAGISWLVMTHDLLWAGFAWELAELGRWFCQIGTEQLPGQRAREQLRQLISSIGFWLGIALIAVLWRTTNLAQLAAHLSNIVPRTADGQILGVASNTGLAAALLICSAVGIRAGLLPWSFGRQPPDRGESSLLDHGLNQLLGLAMMGQVSIALGEGFGGPLAILWSISAAMTALWSAIAVVGETKVFPVSRALISMLFTGLSLMVAGLLARPSALSTGIPAQCDAASLLNLLAQGTVAVTVISCAVISLLRQIGKPEFGEPYFDHYRGLFARRPLAAVLLTSLLIGISGRVLSPVWLTGWASLTSVIMTPLPRMQVPIVPHPVLILAAGGCLLAGVMLLGRVADWMCRLAFDPPVVLPTPGTRPLPFAVSICLIVLAMMVMAYPQLLGHIIKAFY